MTFGHKCLCPHPTVCQEKSVRWSSWLPKVYCISLSESDDRMNMATQEFHRVGLCSLVEFYRPARDTSNVRRPGTRGCWESHRAVAMKAIQEGFSHALITEDDLCFSNTPDLENLESVFKGLPDDWEVFYLGHMPLFGYPTRFDLRLWRTWSECLHCYVINTAVMRWMADHPYDAEPIKETFIWKKEMGQKGIDDFVRRRFVQYSLFPMISYQRGLPTTNPKSVVPFGNAIQGILNPTGHKIVEVLMVLVFMALVVLVIGIMFWVARRIASPSHRVTT